jgi:hypothetical protein
VVTLHASALVTDLRHGISVLDAVDEQTGFGPGAFLASFGYVGANVFKLDVRQGGQVGAHGFADAKLPESGDDGRVGV